MTTLDNVALFIGVNDYSAFDASMGNRPGTSNLFGSRNDALAFWRICRTLGIQPENLRILTSPTVDPAEIDAPATCVGEATEAEILAGVEWLAGRLADKGRPPGLLTYSGHGDFLEGEGLVICPSDVTGANLEHAIPFSVIQQCFVAQRALWQLTDVLDCCYSGATSLTARPLPPGIPQVQIGDRELAACRPNGTSWQSMFSGFHRGAFSWALSAVMEQWKSQIEGNRVEILLSYRELVDRARRLLEVLSFDQVPVLRAKPEIAKKPIFHSWPGGANETSAAPNGRRKGGQLDPNMVYSLTLSSSTNTWNVFTTDDASEEGLTAFTEYWQLDSAFMEALLSARAITFRGESLGSKTPSPTTGFAMPTDSLWVPMAPEETAFWSGPITSDDQTQTYVVGLVLNDLVQPSDETGVWSGTMTWYVGVDSGNPPEYIIGSGTVELTSGSTPEGYTWYSMTLPPLTWSSSIKTFMQGQTYDGTSLAMLNDTQSLTSLIIADINAIGMWTVGPDWVLELHRSGGSTEGSVGVPAIAALGQTLYMAYGYEGEGGNMVYTSYTTTPSHNTWSNPQSTGVTTTSAPALASLGDVIYLTSFQSSSDIYVGSSTDQGGSWTKLAAPTGVEVSGAPALAAFGGTLYLAVTTSGTAPRINVYQWNSNASAWVLIPALDPLVAECPNGIRDPGLGVFNGRLFLACSDADSGDVWLCSTADGTTWVGYTDLTTQLPSVAGIRGAPALGSQGSTFGLAFINSSAAITTWPTIAPA